MAKYSFKDTIKAIGAAALGVQSDTNRKRDFSEGKFSHFVIGGLIAVILFIAFLLVMVNLAVSYAQ